MMLHRSTMKMLSDLISPKALERILSDAARERHTTLSALDIPTLQDILKRDIYKRLQLSVPAALAKRRVQDVLDSLSEESPQQILSGHSTQIVTLEDQARQFALYFDWPETQRLRAVLGVAKQTTAEGRDSEALLQEGVELIESLERRLSEGLVMQGQDLSEMKASMARLGSVGGPKVKRLDTLIKQIGEAQESRTLLPAEVERALALTLTLRKQVESSVVQQLGPDKREMVDSLNLQGQDDLQPFDISLLTPEAQVRVQTLEREHELRQLTELMRDHATVLRLNADLEAEVALLRERSAAGQVLGEATMTAARERLAAAKNGANAQQQAQLTELAARLTQLTEQAQLAGRDADGALQLAHQMLSVAQGTLQAGGLATDEIAQLGGLVQTLDNSDHLAREHLMTLQRETFELERRAREVPGAMTDLAPLIEVARAALASGQTTELEGLWSILERRMGEAAQQRDDMDTRALVVMQDYDRFRHLAGETIQKLGRLADVLRNQQRLGVLSSEARTRYIQTLESAEALLSEAQAEFQAARDVTATFGADALSDLLGVFDSEAFEHHDSGANLLSTESFAPLPAPEPVSAQWSLPVAAGETAPQTPGAPKTVPLPSADQHPLSQAAPPVRNDPFGLGNLLGAAAPVPAPGHLETSLALALSGTASADAARTAAASGGPGQLVRTWLVARGQVVEGNLSPAGDWVSETDCESDVLRLAWLAAQASDLHPTLLTLEMAGRCWLALPQLDGTTLVSFAPDHQAATEAAAQWRPGTEAASN